MCTGLVKLSSKCQNGWVALAQVVGCNTLTNKAHITCRRVECYSSFLAEGKRLHLKPPRRTPRA